MTGVIMKYEMDDTTYNGIKEKLNKLTFGFNPNLVYDVIELMKNIQEASPVHADSPIQPASISALPPQSGYIFEAGLAAVNVRSTGMVGKGELTLKYNIDGNIVSHNISGDLRTFYGNVVTHIKSK
jgi:hypothetical protein